MSRLKPFAPESFLPLALLMFALTLGSCNQQSSASVANASSTTGSASAIPVSVALPNFTALVKKEGPAVVNISSTRKIRGEPQFPALPGLSPDDPFNEFFRRFSPGDEAPREFRSQSLGSGFIVSTDGYVLTNAHVVEDAEEVTVRLTDQREFKVKVIGSDRRSDIALLKIPAKDLPVVNIGDSSKLEVGEWVVAIGSPFGFTNSVSQGIVSAMGRSLPGEDIVPFIQTDVPINPGNSGGPLFNMNGEVIGVNSQIYSRSGGYMGLSFAIPIELAMKVKDELLKHGTVRRGRLGITIQSVSPEHAKSFDLPKAGGALITSVEKDGPADRAGLQIGDIILKFDGKEMASTDDLVRAVANTAPGSSAKLQVWRNGTTREVTISLGETKSERMAQKQEQQDKTAQPAHLGLAVRELAHEEQRALHTDGHLVVEAVTGVAAESGIQPGDIIIAVNSQRVATTRQLRAALDKAGKHAAVLVQREDNMIFLPLKFQKE
ncbi:MAG TPA: DegQ family serine endoprotease [Gallionella sp.]|nr:DegQ family serine endoprotease [Gallionella sp.]